MDLKIAHNLEDKERTKDIAIEENVTFEEMYLSDNVLSGLHACGFIRPSPIQLSAIPLGKCGLDLIVQAKSGTGKTCVFCVIALEMISTKAKSTQVLVITPTREIAVQAGQVMNSIGSSMPDLRAMTFIGGMNLQDDISKLKCCHIAIGTPGRLNQLVTLGHLKLSNVRLLVVDEADQLLTGQFKDSILEIVKTLPHNKQILALSATYPYEVTEFLDNYMRSPSHVRLGKESPALIGVNQFVRLLPDHPQSYTRHKIKFNELLSILSSLSFNQCLVFSNSQLRAESICNQLKSSGWPTAYLTGGQIQSERLQSFFALCSYKCRILVSTDLSARGLDSEHVNLVINLDVPKDSATYLHRVGRAGRFGTKGNAISLVCEGEEWDNLRAITTMTNIEVRIIPENYSNSFIKSDYKNFEIVPLLSEEKCADYLDKQTKKKKRQSDRETKENISPSSGKVICRKNKIKDKVSAGISSNEIEDKKLISKCSENNSEAYKSGSIFNDVKFALWDCPKNFESLTFSYDTILNEIRSNWVTVSKCDSSSLVKGTILKNYPKSFVFDSLGNYIKQREKEITLNTLPLQKCIPSKALETLEDHLQYQILNKDSDEIDSKKDSDNGINSEQYLRAEIDIKDYEHNDDSAASEFSRLDASTVKKSSLINVDSCSEAPTKNHNNEERSEAPSKNRNNEEPNSNFNERFTTGMAASINSVEQHANVDNMNLNKNGGSKSYTEKQREFSSNTGYGMWQPITQKTNDIPERYAFAMSDSCSYSKFNRESETENYNSSENRNYLPHNDMTIRNSHYYDQYVSSTDMYIKSAQKFAVMMEYVKSVGKMSAWIAKDNESFLLGQYCSKRKKKVLI